MYNIDGEVMLSIKENITNEIIIEKSKFVTEIFYLNSFEDIKTILKDINKKYDDATHRCYAYIYEEKKKCSDDGEPNGTAGLPILNVLENNYLDHVLCVVIRYFGGIKLGTGGLIRAYTKSTTEAILKSTILELIPSYKVLISFKYDLIKQVNNICKEFLIEDKKFDIKINYILNIPQKKWDDFQKKLQSLAIDYQLLKSSTIKK